MGTQAKVIAFRSQDSFEKAETNFHATTQVYAVRSRWFFGVLCTLIGALSAIAFLQPFDPAHEGMQRYLAPGQENTTITALNNKISMPGVAIDPALHSQNPYASLPLMSETQQKELMYWMDYYASEPGASDRPMPIALQRWVKQNIAQDQQAQIHTLFAEYRSYWVDRQQRPSRPLSEQSNVAAMDKAQWVWMGD